MVFDLDPGEGTSIVECCIVAELVIDELAEEEHRVLRQDERLQGSPAVRSHETQNDMGRPSGTTRTQAARKLETEHPDLVVSNMRKSLRRRRVLIDWNQNHPAKTTIGVYSVRAMAAPTVSTPVTHSEVHTCATKNNAALLRFTTADVLRRVDRDGDLFGPLALR